MLFLEFANASTGTKVTVSNIRVTTTDNIAAISYPNEATNSEELGIFKVRDHHGSITGDGDSVTMTCAKEGNTWERGLFISDICDVVAGVSYQVSFDIQTDGQEFNYNVCYNRNGHFGDNQEKYFGATYNLNATSTKTSVPATINKDLGGKLMLFLEFANADTGTKVTVSNIQVTTEGNIASVDYPSVGGSFSVGATAPHSGTISAESSAAILTCTGDSTNDLWKRKLFVNDICDLTAGKAYEVKVEVAASETITPYEICYNRNGAEKGFDAIYGLTAETTAGTVTKIVPASESGSLSLQLNLGKAAKDNTVTVSGITVREVPLSVASTTDISFSSFDTEVHGGYTALMERHSDYVSMDVTRPASADPATWKAKLCVSTDQAYDVGKNYRFVFEIEADKDLGEFCVITKGLSNSEDVRGTWGLSLTAGQKKTITTRAIPAGRANGALGFDVELGKFNENVKNVKFTIRKVELQEVIGSPSVSESRITGTVTNDAQENYTTVLTRAKDSAALEIKNTPATGMEAWKSKLFIDTGIKVNAGEAYRVIFDTLAENDMDFEVCYNRGGVEKGFAAIYGLHASAGTAKKVEKMVFAEGSGKLIVQLSLGNVPAPNEITVSNFRVERVKYSYSGKSALPAEISYQAGAASAFVHADYAASFTNTADSITAHITPPVKNPEPWKIKLFLDTGVALQSGKYYKVTTNVSAKKSQNYEICYNNGGIEFGYDSMGGLKVIGGKTQPIEKLISVPADKKDTNNLMLQINLGKTAIANEVTISNVTVEEVTLAYANALGKDFSYQKSLSTWTDPKTTYKAKLDSGEGAATLHISDVPASGTGVWMVKLFAHTGAMLEAGKSYQVSADLLAANAQDFETCFNNEETEKGFDAIYGQKLAAGVKTTVEKRISVPASMTDAGELVLQFSVGGAVANDITVSNISVLELQYGGNGTSSVPNTVISLSQDAQASGKLDVTREKLSYHAGKITADGKDNTITVAGADLRANDRYTVAFKAKADKGLNGNLVLAQANGKTTVLSQAFALSSEEQTYTFTTTAPLSAGGAYELQWQFSDATAQTAEVELSDISVYVPAETLQVTRGTENVIVNGKPVKPDSYCINGNNYFKLRDLAVLLNGTDAQFVVRYNPQSGNISLTTGKEYTPVGGELTIGADYSATCVRSFQSITLNGKPIRLKAFLIGWNNYFRLRDLAEVLGFQVDYIEKSKTVTIASPLTPEKQEASYAYNVFFRPEIDGESQPYVGDTMPFYDNGTYYIYYLKEGGDSYNHSVYLTTTKDFVHYTERPTPVLDASRGDVQDSWIGTGSVVKVDGTYYFFYTGFNASGSQEYHEKIMVAKGNSPTSFTKVGGWSITPPAELNQKNDFRDPQAYYDPATKTISLTVTASKDGVARILKYTLDKDLSNVKYDGVIFTDPTGAFYNLECSDTFRLGNKWYLTYSGQDDTLWYASADSRFGPYSAPERMDGTIFYAAKHVENGKNSYMVGWTRRSASASSTDEVSGWGGNLAVQQLKQNADGSLSMVPVESIASAFHKSVALGATSATLTAGSGYSYKKAFTSSESFKLSGEFTYTGTGSFGLAFDFDGTEDQYKLITVDPAEGKLRLSFNGGATQIAETQAKLDANQKHSFTYIQDGSVGIFYLDGQTALTVRLYGVTDKPIYLFAENNSVTFTSLQQFTR